MRDLLQRASSSLLVGGGDGNGNGAGKLGYDFNVAKLASCQNWGYCGDLGVVASSEAGASNAVDASARSLLRKHISQPNDQFSSPSSHRSSPKPSHVSSTHRLSSSIFASSYSPDDCTYYTGCEGAEPTVTQTPNHLEIDIRDDQIFLAAKACFARKGFTHALVVFTVSGVVINTLSTFLDYLVRVSYNDGLDSTYYDENNINAINDQSGTISSASMYVALIGGLFQIVIMISSVVVGSFTDKTRSYFIVILVLLVLGAFALAECGVSLDADRGGDVRLSLLLVSGLLGPLLPVATELGVEMAYPLSENTVLVILQLSCNLVSALFIPLFQAVKDVGVTVTSSAGGDEIVEYDDAAALVLGSGRPTYTFSFYLLILLCAISTVHFATFDGKYLRLEAELAKKLGGDSQQQSSIPSQMKSDVPLMV